MAEEDGSADEALVGLVIVSHSAMVAEGVVEFARLQAGDVRVLAAGGVADPATGRMELGTDAARIADAVRAADSGAGVVVLGDILGAFLAIDTALELVRAEDPALADRTRVSGGPLVEGAYFAAIQASIGDSLERVLENADAAAAIQKLER
jgi:dihydroxyacetone kinase DhaKLM complex PTS-EIIA-like component DhaM